MLLSAADVAASSPGDGNLIELEDGEKFVTNSSVRDSLALDSTEVRAALHTMRLYDD